MFWHHNVADKRKAMACSKFPQDFNEGVSRVTVPEARCAAIAAKRDEVEVALTVVAFYVVGHRKKQSQML